MFLCGCWFRCTTFVVVLSHLLASWPQAHALKTSLGLARWQNIHRCVQPKWRLVHRSSANKCRVGSFVRGSLVAVCLRRWRLEWRACFFQQPAWLILLLIPATCSKRTVHLVPLRLPFLIMFVGQITYHSGRASGSGAAAGKNGAARGAASGAASGRAGRASKAGAASGAPSRV